MPGRLMNQEKDERKMSAQTGLTSRQNYDRFVGEWYDTVLREAQKWCRSDEAARLLTEAVLNDCRQKFAAKKLPSEPEYYLKGQVCLVYSMTGPNVERLKSYILDHPFAEEDPDSEEAAAPEDTAKPAAPAAGKAVRPAEKKETQLPPERAGQLSTRAAESPKAPSGENRTPSSTRPGQSCGVRTAKTTRISLRKSSSKTMTRMRKSVRSDSRSSIRFSFL